jgi:Trk K+ transport system NAD-binding subunit
LLAPLLLVACGKPDDPQLALEAAAQRLQDALEAKQTSDVIAMLDARFRAQDELDTDWARRTMTLVFMRFNQVRVIAVNRQSRIDEGSGGRVGRTTAQVLVTGAQGLVPERAEPYALELVWWREGDDWKLRDLRWK